MTIRADAQPTKRFFVEMITRDISAIDAILDLVDNSIDAIFQQVPMDIESFIIEKAIEGADLKPIASNFSISVSVNEKETIISDNCGGISVEDATNKAFYLSTTFRRRQFGRRWRGSWWPG